MATKKRKPKYEPPRVTELEPDALRLYIRYLDCGMPREMALEETLAWVEAGNELEKLLEGDD